MKTYRIKFADGVLQTIDRLPGHLRQRVKRTIRALSAEPKPQEAVVMTGELIGYYRIKIDLYRIIYLVHEEIEIVEIVKVAKRGDKTYRGLRPLR
jgi:mRNA-degrading endonuclease RelE of RelBE toxin-antitoxin system